MVYPPVVVSEMRTAKPGNCKVLERFELIIKNERAFTDTGGLTFALVAR